MSIASKAAAASLLAYRTSGHKDHLRAAFPTMEGYHVIEEGGTECLVILFPGGTAWVPFRGTQLTSWSDIWTDLQFRHSAPAYEQDLGISVHTGFKEALDKVWSKVQRKVDGRRVYWTGHSLGGALAVLAASRTHLMDSVNAETAGLITFGQPRVGDRDLAKAMTGVPYDRYYRCVDIVPWLPPYSFNFVHFGTGHWIGCDSFPRPLGDHSMAKYRRDIDQLSIPA